MSEVVSVTSSEFEYYSFQFDILFNPFIFSSSIVFLKYSCLPKVGNGSSVRFSVTSLRFEYHYFQFVFLSKSFIIDILLSIIFNYHFLKQFPVFVKLLVFLPLLCRGLNIILFQVSTF